MPVPGRRLEREVVTRCEMALDHAGEHDGEHDGADRHVEAVEAGQQVERRPVHARRQSEIHLLAVRMVVLVRLKPDEREAKHDRRRDQTEAQRLDDDRLGEDAGQGGRAAGADQEAGDRQDEKADHDRRRDDRRHTRQTALYGLARGVACAFEGRCRGHGATSVPIG